MLAALIVASTSPSVPGPHDAYDWWSDIWVPAIAGVASLAIGYIAVRVAGRSNRLAAAATAAAERSNTIAERALGQEAERAEEQRSEATRQERRRLADRFLVHVDEMAEEMRADPDLWLRPVDSLDDNALFRMSPLIFEATIRGWTDFPSSKSVDFLTTASRAGGGTVRLQLARNAAHTMINFWVEKPGTLAAMIEYIEQDLEKRMP